MIGVIRPPADRRNRATYYFFIEFKNKSYYDDWVNGHREINQSYSCVKEDCNRYFLWSFIDEKIIDNIEKDGKGFLLTLEKPIKIF